MINFFKALIIVLREGPEKIEKLEREAKTDPLTGLLNRRGFQEKVNIEKERSERYGHPFLVVYIDMDDLKKINDSKGHHAGDEALVFLAKNIKEKCRAVDFAARVGGDEFVVVLPETAESEVDTIVKRFKTIKDVSIGYCQYSSSIGKTMRIAEKMMQEKKERRKKTRK